MTGVLQLERIGLLSVHVSDLERARGFYEKVLGLRTLRTLEGEMVYDLLGTPLSVHVDPNGECGRRPGGATGIYLTVPDVANARAELERAGARVGDHDATQLDLYDPDGNLFVVWRPKKGA